MQRYFEEFKKSKKFREFKIAYPHSTYLGQSMG